MADSKTSPDRRHDPARLRRLQADARRPLGENLAETIALSHALHRLAAGARLR